MKKVKHSYVHVKLLLFFVVAKRDLTNAHKDHLYCILKVNKLHVNTMPVDKAIALLYKQRLGNVWDSNRFVKYNIIYYCSVNRSCL